jgi:predicted ferric reductase
MNYFAAAICGLLGVFIVFHLGRVLAQRARLGSKAPGLASPLIHASRAVRHVLIRKVKLFPSLGHAALTIVYVAINLILMFTNMDSSLMAYHNLIAARTGWLAIGNLVVVVFLSLKNTPLGYLTAWSYERINALHQIAGYTLMSLIIIHGSTYASYFAGMGNYARLTAKEEIMGMVAGGCLLTLVFAGTVIRRFWYELFYVVHVLFFMAGLIFIALHQPEASKHIMIATTFAGALWSLDRVIRFLRLAAYSINNSATVHPLPNGGTRIVLKKTPIGAKSGAHCFVWIPKARLLEMHPFTIASTDPLEFVVASYDGFTRDLHKYAVANPGGSVWASTEGPYGKFPDTALFDKVVMVAGGSGASFTFGMALDILRKRKADKAQQIRFEWMVKDQAQFAWFSNAIATLKRDPNVAMSLHVTRSSLTNLPLSPEPPRLRTPVVLRPRASSLSSVSHSEPSSPTAEEKHEEEKTAIPAKVKTTGIADPEKEGGLHDVSVPVTPVHESEVASSIHGVHISHRRPDVAAIIRDVVESTPKGERVLVIGCGPENLMTLVRNTTAGLIRTAGPGVELHCEQFGW